MLNILTVAEYKAKTNLSTEDIADNEIHNYLNQATNQIDNYCGGTVFKEYPTLKPDVDADAVRIFKLQSALVDLVDLFFQTGKMFMNSVQQGGGSAPFNLRTTSRNSSIETIRQDIIQSLIQGGWYKNLRIDGHIDFHAQIDEDAEFQKLVGKLSAFFLRTDGENTYNSSLLNLPNTANFNNVGDITGGDVIDSVTGQLRTPKLLNFAVDNVSVDVAENSKKIWDTTDRIYKFLSDYDVDYFGGMPKADILATIYASGSVWLPTFNYQKDNLTYKVDEDDKLQTYLSLVNDNLNNDPEVDPTKWKVLLTTEVDVAALIEQLKPYIDTASVTAVRAELAKYQRVPIANFAKKDQSNVFDKTNTFTAKQIIDNTVDGDDLVINRKTGLAESRVIFSNDDNANKSGIISSATEFEINGGGNVLKLNGFAVRLGNDQGDPMNLGGVKEPTNDDHAANKKYVDDAVAGGGGSAGGFYIKKIELITSGSSSSYSELLPFDQANVPADYNTDNLIYVMGPSVWGSYTGQWFLVRKPGRATGPGGGINGKVYCYGMWNTSGNGILNPKEMGANNRAQGYYLSTTPPTPPAAPTSRSASPILRRIQNGGSNE